MNAAQQLEQRISQIDKFLTDWQAWSDRNFSELQQGLILVAKGLYIVTLVLFSFTYYYSRKLYAYWAQAENRHNAKDKAVEVYETAKRYVIAVYARIASVASFVVGYALQVYDR